MWGLGVEFRGLECRVVQGVGLGCRVYLEGQGDLVSRLITPVTHIVTLIIPIINLLTKSP